MVYARLTAFLSLLALLCLAHAFELSPEVYKGMQKKAPEFLTLTVQDVKTKVSRKPGITETAVTVTARAAKVSRSKSGLKPGKTITIRYVHPEYDIPVSGPSPVPILKRGNHVPAYLKLISGTTYEPAAGGFTFETVR